MSDAMCGRCKTTYATHYVTRGQDAELPRLGDRITPTNRWMSVAAPARLAKRASLCAACAVRVAAARNKAEGYGRELEGVDA